VSRPVLEAVRRRYRGISMSRISKHLLPLPLWPKHLLVKKTGRFVLNWDGFYILQHPGIDLSFGRSLPDAQNAVRSSRDAYVLVVHSWNFFTPEGRLKDRLLESWEKMLKTCMEDASMRFMTFTEFADSGGGS
jgi:hypothetical protein